MFGVILWVWMAAKIKWVNKLLHAWYCKASGQVRIWSVEYLQNNLTNSMMVESYTIETLYFFIMWPTFSSCIETHSSPMVHLSYTLLSLVASLIVVIFVCFLIFYHDGHDPFETMTLFLRILLNLFLIIEDDFINYLWLLW